MKTKTEKNGASRKRAVRRGQQVEVENDRLFHCWAAFMATIGMGAIDEEAIEERPLTAKR